MTAQLVTSTPVIYKILVIYRAQISKWVWLTTSKGNCSAFIVPPTQLKPDNHHPSQSSMYCTDGGTCFFLGEANISKHLVQSVSCGQKGCLKFSIATLQLCVVICDSYKAKQFPCALAVHLSWYFKLRDQKTAVHWTFSP